MQAASGVCWHICVCQRFHDDARHIFSLVPAGTHAAHTRAHSTLAGVLTYVHVRPAHTCMHRASSLCFPFPFEGRFPGLQALLASPKQQ